MRETHYHAWLRSGRVFTMQDRIFGSRTRAHRWAAGRRPSPEDRLVLACRECPSRMRSRRRPPRWGAIARAVAEAVGAEAGLVREALAAAIAAERKRRDDEGEATHEEAA